MAPLTPFPDSPSAAGPTPVGTPRPAAPRPGGRSARIQQAVHDAVRDLQAEQPPSEQGRSQLTVPQIAHRAGVTPSTIYRRWGDLQELLADVAVEQLRPDSDPEDTGTLYGDLSAWAVAYLEETSSPQGRAVTRDVLASTADSGRACRCAGYTRAQVELLTDRARLRGEPAPSVDSVLDRVVAPLVYRILYYEHPPTAQDAVSLVAGLLAHRVPAPASAR